MPNYERLKMKKSCGFLSGFVVLFFALGLAHAALAAMPPSGRWIGTWAASPEAEPNTTSPLSSSGTTYREVVHISAGGSAARIVVTNEFGREPLTIGAAQIAISGGGSAIDSSTAKTLRFGDQLSVTIPAGAMMVSDPVAIKLPALANVTVSFFLPAQLITQSSVHSYALQTNYQVEGNAVTAATLHPAAEVPSWYFLKGVEVETEGANAPGAIVALGDSITDGAASIENTNGRWPDILANRIQVDQSMSGIAVLNAGINGNRLLHDGDGDESALRRLDRDVIAQAGIQYLIVLEGINDIGHNIKATPSDPPKTAQDLIGALQQIAVRAHAHGIRVIGATILPYENCKYASPDGEKIREAVNDWIRTTPSLDGVADFEKVVRDPSHPTRFSSIYDSGDHLHPNAAGLKAMADSIDLSLFTR
jgi:lysophospholipase L1-like esterase